MKVENGKAVWERRKCWMCDGAGQREVGILCPHYHKVVKNFPGRKCPNCGSKNQHDHKVVGKKTEKCYVCSGNGEYMESINDFSDCKVLETLPIKFVRRDHERQTFADAYLGYGSLVSVTDYGRYKHMTEEQFTTRVRESLTRSIQYSHYVKAADGTVADYLMVVTSDAGWRVVPHYPQPELPEGEE
jgi:hypothetical protein